MDLGIAGKKALVCASSKGLGRATAEALAKEGAEVFLCARNDAELKAVAETIATYSKHPVHWLACDLSAESERDRLVDAVQDEMGAPDIVIHNAGGPPPTSVEETSQAAWLRGFETNFLSVTHLNNAFLPHMKQRRWGRILVITSLSPLQPIPDLAVSNGVRAAVTAMMKTLSNEVAGHNVSVNCIAPGIIHTDRTEERIRAHIEKYGGDRADILAKYAADIPAGRLGNPEEFGRVACFLCSEHAGYINGSTICVDGGKRKSTF